MEYKFLLQQSESDLLESLNKFLKEGWKPLEGLRVSGDVGARSFYVTLVKEEQAPVDDGEVYDKIQKCVEYYNEHYYTYYGNPALLSGDIAEIVNILTGKGDEFFQTIKNLK